MNRYDAHKHLNTLTLGFFTTKCIQIAGELRIADQLTSGPLKVEAIAQRVNAKPQPLYRLLRLLASNGIFHEEEAKAFSNNAVSDLLRSDIPGSHAPAAKLIGDLDFPAAADLIVAITDGEIPWDHHYGKPKFDYVSERPELIGLFNDAMLAWGSIATEAILESCDFSNVGTFADIGGGNGDVVIKTLKKYPNLNGVLFDQLKVVEQSIKNIADAGLADRCKVVGGNFFESIPVESDIYFLRDVLHDWSDEECIAILKNLAKVARPGARVLIAECLIGNPNEGALEALSDMVMLLSFRGRERTAEEYNSLLSAAGIELAGMTHTDSIISVVEGTFS